MKILVLSDSFKETLTASQVLSEITSGIKEVFPSVEVEAYPFSDGGEGFLNVISRIYPDTEKVPVRIKDCLVENEVESYYLERGKKAYLESSLACGLERTPVKNPLLTSSYPLGEIIKKALKRGDREFYIGLGGSATDDFGAGMMTALGVKYFDENGKEILPRGGNLSSIARIDTENLDPTFLQASFTLLSDVDNPLLGEKGATFTFAPQKGARKEDLPLLEEGKKHLALLTEKTTGRKVKDIPGSGAAGGLAGAFLSYGKTTLISGAKTILSLYDKYIDWNDFDLIITGEGKIDKSTLEGKCVSAVAQRGKEHSLPVLAIGGYIEEEVKEPLRKLGVTDFLSVQKEAKPLAEIKPTAGGDLRQAVVEYFHKHKEHYE